MNTTTINVADGECILDDVARSRFNIANVAVGMDLIASLHEAGVLAKHDIKTVTTYSLQRRLWLEAIRQYWSENRISMVPKSDVDLVKADSPKVDVITCSTRRGREADFVIFDSVLS